MATLLAVGALGLAGCSASDSASGETSGTPSSAAASSPTAASGSASPSGTAITAAELSPKIKEFAKKYYLPGAVLGYWEPGKDPVLVAEGKSNLKSKAPMTPQDTFGIGSVTKSFVGTVALQLVDEGKLSLEDPISKYLPDFPNGENITIRQLLAMTSGIADYSADKKVYKKLSENPSAVFKRQELVDAAARLKPYFEPGKGLHYANSNTVLLALIIEKVTGNKVESEVTTRVIEPLGLKNTYFPVDAAANRPTTTGYQLDPQTGKFIEPPPLDPSYLWASGAMVSNVEDLGTWVRALNSGQLLSPQMQAERMKFEPLSVAGAPEFYTQMYPGYGLAVERYGNDNEFVGHSGRTSQYNAQMFYHPQTDSVLVTLSNTDTVAGYGPLFFATMARDLYPGSFPDLDPSATAIPSASS